MSALLLDTHIVLWLDSGDARLTDATRARIEDHWRGGGTLLVSAVTSWEIALLIDGGRITLDVPPSDWIARFLARPGIEAVPLSVAAAARAYALPGLQHRDPADRLLIATALAGLSAGDARCADIGVGGRVGRATVGCMERSAMHHRAATERRCISLSLHAPYALLRTHRREVLSDEGGGVRAPPPIACRPRPLRFWLKILNTPAPLTREKGMSARG